MRKEKFSFNVKEFKKMKEPNDSGSNLTRYIMYIELKSLLNNEKNILEWMETNPRFQNTNTSVGKAIEHSLEDDPTSFHLYNKGILFAADDVVFNNIENKVEITFKNEKINGNIDGGHTLYIILEKLKDNPDLEGYVFVEIFTGDRLEEFIIDLSESRNLSMKVTMESLIEQRDEYDGFKNLITKEAWSDFVYYQMFENKKFPNKTINIRDIIAVTNVFNLSLFQIGTFPIHSYSGKGVSQTKFFNKYSDEGDSKKIQEAPLIYSNIFPKIFELYEEIEKTLYSNIDINQKKWAISVGKAEAKKVVNYTTFTKTKLKNNLIVHKGILFPILSSFRSLIDYNTEGSKFIWKNEVDPIEIFKKVKSELLNIIVDSDKRSPETIGKDKTLWRVLEKEVKLHMLETNS
ncbi:AIPR family protein [Spiroplasma endosymbiont of Othius punctulatus]|uniref:AIPR family protein n=1 Tax=Spiroplasma endosymbiont of Othius punctulatus TaxID=3066289 RepID=UPI0030CAAC14